MFRLQGHAQVTLGHLRSCFETTRSCPPRMPLQYLCRPSGHFLEDKFSETVAARHRQIVKLTDVSGNSQNIHENSHHVPQRRSIPKTAPF